MRPLTECSFHGDTGNEGGKGYKVVAVQDDTAELQAWGKKEKKKSAFQIKYQACIYTLRFVQFFFFLIKCSQIEQEIVEGMMRAQLLPLESRDRFRPQPGNLT